MSVKTNAKLRIVHYLAGVRAEQGGVTRAVLDMCGVMASRGHDVTLITYDTQDVPKPWLTPAPPGSADGSFSGHHHPKVIRLPGIRSRLARLSREALNLATEAIDGASVLHLHGAWDAGNVQLAKIVQVKKIPYVVSPHGMLDDWSMRVRGVKKRLFLKLGGRKFLEAAAFVHCTAMAEAEQAKKWFPRGRAEVMPYIVDLSPFERLPGPEAARAKFNLSHDAGGPVVLFLSRVHPKKGVEVLLAASEILQHNMKHRLIIAGPGEPEYVAQLKKSVASSGGARFLDAVGGAEKLSLYQAADVFVLPTSQENFGLVLVEALACGTPVVTTKGVDIWREIESAGGVIVEQDSQRLTDALVALLKDAPALPARGERGRRWVLEHLNVDRVAAEYEGAYGKVIPPGGTGGH